jgi:RNA polymerase sigma-70 factor (family 1)
LLYMIVLIQSMVYQILEVKDFVTIYFVEDGETVFLCRNKTEIMVSWTDAELISGIKSGSERAFEELFRGYYPRLSRYAFSLLKDLDEAEEVVQNMFLNIWEKKEGLEITLSLKSYLYRAVHNFCLNRIKHLQVRDAHKDYTVYAYSEGEDSLNEVLNGHELEIQIENAVRKLPEQCQLVFRMSRFEELKYQEIADRLSISVKTVENQIGKALKILRSELAEYLPLLIWLLPMLSDIKFFCH